VSQRESAVVYDGLPISSGGAHGLGRTTAYAAHSAWSRFLSACTSPGPITCYFDLPVTPELTVEPHVRELISRTFPATGPRFPVPPERVTEALDLLSALEPQPTNPWGMASVWLRFSANFALRSPDGEVWPGQDPSGFGFFETPTGVRLGASTANLNLEARRSMGLLLSVPDATDADLAVMVPWLQSHLPFRLSPRQWTRWTLAKNGRTYRGRKLVT
jgi:hypothetical protein